MFCCCELYCYDNNVCLVDKHPINHFKPFKYVEGLSVLLGKVSLFPSESFTYIIKPPFSMMMSHAE